MERTLSTVETEHHRHACEALDVATMPSDAARRHYLDLVASRRGADAAARLRADAWTIMRRQGWA